MTSFKNSFPAGPLVLVSANSRYAYSLSCSNAAISLSK
jgi:hypothetical protein